MKSVTLARLFLRVLAAAPALVACSPGGAMRTCGGVVENPEVSVSTLEQDLDASSGIDAGTTLPLTVCIQFCSSTGFCSVASVQGSTATLECRADCTGRRPEGLSGECLPGGFAEMARLEAASVDAFRRLRTELASHGAPRRLLRACSRAMRDEVRHARRMRGLARRRGERTEAPRIDPARTRSLEALAIENAVEGCVRETWGALVATRDAATHPDADVRAAMKRIAGDETRHAALAWQVASWLEPRLDSLARSRVRAARDAEARTIVARSGDAAAAELAQKLWGLT